MELSSCQLHRSLPFVTLFKATQRILPEDIHAKVHYEYQRQCVQSVDDRCINEYWSYLQKKQKLSKPNALFNALKFRLHNVFIPLRCFESNNITTDTKRNNKSEQEERCTVDKKFCCELWLGITDYKSSIGTTTHIASYEEYALNVPSETNPSVDIDSNSDIDNERMTSAHGRCVINCNSKNIHCYLSNALGVESIAVTSDGQAVLFCRSQDVAEYKGYYCCPGGHPEPARLLNACISKINSHHINKKSERDKEITHINTDASSKLIARDNKEVNPSCNDNNISNTSDSHISETIDTTCTMMMNHLSSKAIVDELFESIVLEVADELGLSVDKCHNYGLMCIMEATTTFKPDLCFWVQLDYSSQEVQSCFDKRCGTDAFESVAHSLRFVPINQLSTEESVHELVEKELHGLLTPSSYASLVHAVSYKKYIPI